MLPFILQGLALGFAAAVQPGPFMAYLISQTLAHGFKRAWIAAFAPLISDGPIIALALLVLSQLPEWLRRGLNLAGGVFILYLAWGAYQKWRTYSNIADAETPAGQSLFKAAFMNALSPAPYIYWSLVTGPILIAGWNKSPSYGIGFIVAFYALLIGGVLGIMALFNLAKSRGEQVSRSLLGVSALAMAAFGLFQIWRGLQ